MKDEIKYNANVSFKGSLEDFEKVTAELTRLSEEGLMIDTVPTPTHPAKGMMIDTVPLPEKWAGVAIGTIPLSEDKIAELAIGSWPTPERTALTVIRWPRPEPFPGIIAATKILSPKILEELGKGMVKINTGIDGGMKEAHFHMKDSIVMLTKDRFKQFMGHVIQELGRDLLK